MCGLRLAMERGALVLKERSDGRGLTQYIKTDL